MTIYGIIKPLNSSLTNENAETFNFGYLNGVRGFFTNPSRADDSFIPFSGSEASIRFVSGNATTSNLSIPFTPSCDLSSIVIGGRRYGAVFTAYIKDESGSDIASCLITASAADSGVKYAKEVSITEVNCALKKDETYTLYIPAAGSSYAHFAFAVYA